jgi:Na+/proline symporter
LKIEKVYLFKKKKRKSEEKRRREGIRARGAWPLYWLYFFFFIAIAWVK